MSFEKPFHYKMDGKYYNIYDANDRFVGSFNSEEVAKKIVSVKNGEFLKNEKNI